jgi:TonB family protein
MRENLRLYLLISLVFHLVALLPLLLMEGPRVSELVPRRVVIEFTESPERTPPELSPEKAKLPELRPSELADSLQMHGPAVLPVPGAGLGSGPSQVRRPPAEGDRLDYRKTEQPVLPEPNSFAPPIPPAELLRPETVEPAEEEGGFDRAGALEWKGRERRLLRAAGIRFPDILLEEGLEVDVEAVLIVAPNGQVSSVDIVRGSGYASVDRAVERAILGYLFEPSGGPGDDVGRIRFRFRLKRGD